jgi:hypothetical protein
MPVFRALKEQDLENSSLLSQSKDAPEKYHDDEEKAKC